MSIRSAGWMPLLALSAWTTGAVGQQPAASAPAAPDSPVATSSGAAEPPASADATSGGKMLPPCIPVHRARPKHHKPKEAPAAQTPVAVGPPAPEPADAVVDAQVGEVGTSLGSILGREVATPKGEDLGRVVDVLADARGHVRVAIIDFGGFLGVGTRRIAVDWPLLRFDENARDKPLILSVDRQKLQSAPEYNSNKPRVLMPPAAPDAADPGQTKK
jgi:PRC-barrel domain